MRSLPELVTLLPGNSNLELVRLLCEEYSDCPVILLTGYPSLPSAMESQRLNVFDYIAKPFDVDHLLKRVARGIRQRRR